MAALGRPKVSQNMRLLATPVLGKVAKVPFGTNRPRWGSQKYRKNMKHLATPLAAKVAKASCLPPFGLRSTCFYVVAALRKERQHAQTHAFLQFCPPERALGRPGAKM